MGAIVRVGSGDGAVARFGECVLILPDALGPEPEFAELIDICRYASAAPPAEAARVAAGLVAATLFDGDMTRFPRFALLAPAPGSVVVLVRGDVRVRILSVSGTVEVSGERVVTWVEHVVEDQQAVVEVGATPSAQPDLRYQLDEGVVRGSSAVVSLGAQVAPAEQSEDRAARAEARLEAVKADAPDDEAGAIAESRSNEHLPDPFIRQAARAAVLTSSGTPSVRGILCEDDHFNPPGLRYCRVCGKGMFDRTATPADGPRPPLGVLLIDDGSQRVVHTTYVLGREPTRDPAVEKGEALPLVIEDPYLRVSRVHAKILVDGWSVLVMDLQSDNGTFVTADGGQPQRVSPGARVALTHRGVMSVGSRSLTFFSHFPHLA